MASDFTDERLAEVEELAKEATQGKWKADAAQRGDCVVWGSGEDSYVANVGGSPISRVVFEGEDESEKETLVFDVEEANCRFIAATDPDTVLSMCQRIREQAEEIKRHNELFAQWRAFEAKAHADIEALCAELREFKLSYGVGEA